VTINFKENANFIWSIADLLRGDYKQSEYGRVILPLTVLRRLDCVLEPTKEAVLSYLPQTKGLSPEAAETVLKKKAKLSFYNKSKFDFQKLVADPNDIAANLRNYINGFSKNARNILEHFNFDDHIERLDKANLLYMVVKRFAEVDLHPDKIKNIEMGYIFEELIRKFADLSNETAGEHFTPREVIRLMVNILFLNDKEILTKKGILKTLYDPACGTGGMLSVAEEYLRGLNPDADLRVFGQELNPESYAICNSDMLIKGQNTDHIKFGNSFTEDGLKNEKFDYMLSNPPFGVEWKKIQGEITKEYEQLGLSGRFGAGLPRISDGSFLFLQHMLSKMKPVSAGGSRIGIVFNRSPLYAGDAESGESNIRKWILKNDYLEGIIALPTSLFYNTGIPTYIWILSNRKNERRQGRVQCIDASEMYATLRRCIGEKRHEIIDEHINEITEIYGKFKENKICKIFTVDDFFFKKVALETPLRLKFHVTDESIEKFEQSKEIRTLKKKKSDYANKLLKVIKKLVGVEIKTRSAFDGILLKEAENYSLKLTGTIYRILMKHFTQKDADAEVFTDEDGTFVSDSDSREYEYVSCGESSGDYFSREINPYLSNVWIDESSAKEFVEIPFIKSFVHFNKKRKLLDILNDLNKLMEDQTVKLKR